SEAGGVFRRSLSSCHGARGHRRLRACSTNVSDDEFYQRTTLMMLQRDSPDMMFVDSYSRVGFVINGNSVMGPCALIPNAILQWNVVSSLVFVLLSPEMLLLGTGDCSQRLDSALLKFMKRKGIGVEVQGTPNACATFNFLMSDRRIVGAALIPPSKLPEDD
uniref:NADH dehydrogenase [ubiquinone] 1 alpha subcomplex assembly factor 3 n=1 Tax=Eptatretus burgeri TaxID=7764 RepID=A0A8C4NGD2_EPTBU